MKISCLLLLLLLFSSRLYSQEAIGLNPPGMKWHQIATPVGRVIFPEGLDSTAFRAAGIMTFQKEFDGSVVGKRKTKNVPTILQNQSSMPAGFSTPAPWRNEFYLTPPQNLFTGPVPWTDYLTIHEYRHAQQFQMANKGTTLPLKVLMGETGWLLHALFNQPLWFREGDAVTSETLLTKGGRGRQPRFHQEYRALRLSGLHYNYEKANMPASFKHFVPNPYRIGYYMTTKLRRDHGDSIWEKVLHGTYHGNPVYGFNRSLKDHTGYSTKTLYNQTVKELDSIFQETDKNLKLTAHKVISPPAGKTYTNYRFPHYLPDGSLVVLKDAFDEIRTFYMVRPDGTEEKLFPYGVYTDDHIMFSVAGNLLTWAEAGFDERWVNQDFSVIKTFNFQTGQSQKLTSRTRYFAPAPSPDGSKIAAVHSSTSGQHSLVILDAATGNLLKELPNPGNPFLAQPRWAEDNEQVICLAVNELGNSILQVNTQTGESKTVLPFITVPISRPYLKGDLLYFSGGHTGIDNIYALRISSGQAFQVTSVRFGAYEPMVSENGRKLVYSQYTANGYEIAETEMLPETLIPLTADFFNDLNFHKPLLTNGESTGNRDITALNFRTDYQVKKYRALTDGLFRFYGWFPTFGNSQYGAEFYTRNLMSTLRGTVTLFYNTNENAFGTKINLAYAAFYPVVDLEYGLQTRRKYEIRNSPETEINEQEWTENYWLAGLRLPLILTQGKYHTNLEAGGAFGQYKVGQVPDPELTVQPLETDFNAWRGTLNFNRILPQSRQQVKPRWGQRSRLQYQKAINEDPERIFADATLYFPGIKKTHSFNLEGRFKKETVRDTYRFLDDFRMPRGYLPDPFNRIWVVSGNYELPVWYPDLALGRVFFFQRFRTNLFYDHSRAALTFSESNLNATGTELFLDLRLLRLFSVSMGVRYNYTFNDGFTETTPFQFVVSRFELVN